MLPEHGRELTGFSRAKSAGFLLSNPWTGYDFGGDEKDMERFFFAATLFVIALAGLIAATSHGGVLGLPALAPRPDAIAVFSR